MKKIPVKQITSWSYSRYATYKLCPLKAKLAYIDKIKEPPNQAMQRGIDIHNLAEDYIKGKIPRLPVELKNFKKTFQALKKQYKKEHHGMVVEDNWSFTKEWNETQWDDWINCWVRIKLDCAFHEDDETLVIYDWKTGKYRPQQNEDYIEQLELYAFAALLLHDHIKEVHPKLIYLDACVIYPDDESIDMVFTKEDLPELKKTWEKRVRPMLNDKIFAPRPNNLCSWCHYRASNKANGGGQCKF